MYRVIETKIYILWWALTTEKGSLCINGMANLQEH